MLSPEKTKTFPFPSTVAVGYQRATLMFAAFDQVFVVELKIDVSLIPTSACTLPPTTITRPSGNSTCPEQKRFVESGTGRNVPVVGFQIVCEFGASSQASNARMLPVGRSAMWTATIGHELGADH